jgi:preprotein translocase subunit SecG
LHVIVSLILILVVLLQTGKRADLAGAFGGGGSQTAFGTRGAATFLSKMTTTAAVLFMLTSLGLSLVGAAGRGAGGTVLPEEEPAGASVPAPENSMGDNPIPIPLDENTPVDPADDNVPVDPAEEVESLEEAVPEDPDTSGGQQG